jgi:hypothetical protein
MKAPHERPVRALALLREQPAGHHQQRQGEREAVGEHAQLDAAVFGVELLLRIALQIGQRGARALLGLARVEHDLLLRVDPALHFFFLLLEGIERLRACDEFGVLVGLRGGAARGQPVAEGFARIGVGLLRGLQLQAELVELARGLLLGRLRLFDDGAQRLRRGLVDEVVQHAHALDLRQVAHHGAAEPDQEAREHEGHEPEAAAKPFL